MPAFPREAGREASREFWNVDHPAYDPRTAPAQLPTSQLKTSHPSRALNSIEYAHTQSVTDPQTFHIKN